MIDAAPQLLGESNYALAMTLLERMQREVEQSFASCNKSDSTTTTTNAGVSKCSSTTGEVIEEENCPKALQLKPSGAMLFWLSSPDNSRQEQQQPADTGVAFDSYAVPQ